LDINENGQILPPPKICQRKKSAGKDFCFFFLLRPKKGEAGSERRQRKTPKVAEVRAQRQRVGGEKIRLLCPTEVFTSLIKGRGGRDRAKNNSLLKNFVRRTLNKNKFFARTRTQGCLACRAGRKGRRKLNRKD